MKVKDIMTVEPRTCGPDTNLAAAAALMLDADCGMLPVVIGGKLAGVVTDRDLYIALATRNQRPSDLSIGDVMQTPLHTCGPDDDVEMALATMKQHRVRRLPVEGFGGTVIGVLSLNDIARAAGSKRGITSAELIGTLQAISHQHRPVPHVASV